MHFFTLAVHSNSTGGYALLVAKWSGTFLVIAVIHFNESVYVLSLCKTTQAFDLNLT